jgi:hypothetical protein
MDKLHNDQTKKDKMAYNDLENITQKTKDRVEHHYIYIVHGIYSIVI